MEQLENRDFRVAFFDVDGTLLGFNGEYTQRLKNALWCARDKGLKTAIASGRPMFATEFLIDDLGLVDAGVFYTGALVYDPSRAITLSQHALGNEEIASLLAVAKSHGIYTEIYTRDHFYIEGPHPIAAKHSHHLRCNPIVGCFDDMPDDPVIKLLLAVTEPDQHQLLQALEEQFPHLIFAYAHLAEEPDWLFVSVISDQACKKQAFLQLLKYYDARPDQVLAFGDAQSDMQFLSLAGTGVAMGNASDQVKQVADLVTLPVWDDGVAHVLEMITQDG
ncbi:HAD family hydrolase [Candidatus Pelagadaptatus aseana]|uniref:HAD family hydrolase n=1 Tax=Candidatus Pelagadaptatus aseana TaxID=3120508 RepID=UPI003C6EAB55